MKRKVIIGCCGWGYLKTRSFSNILKEKHESLLQAYAELFDAVEINYTFYRLAREVTLIKWRKEADVINKNFEFTVKAYKMITHQQRFNLRSIKYFDLIKSYCHLLKSKIVLFQTPANFKPTVDNLKSVHHFFSNLKRKELNLVWEPRGNWDINLIQEICERHQLVHCVDPLRDKPAYIKNQKITYFRLHGLGEIMYHYNFSRRDYEDLIQIVKSVPEDAEVIYIFFNNTNCYENAYEFKKCYDLTMV